MLAKSFWCLFICLSTAFSKSLLLALRGASKVGLPTVGVRGLALKSLKAFVPLILPLANCLPPSFNKSPAKGIKPMPDKPAKPRFMAPSL